MANEATLMFERSLPIPMICTDGSGIAEGAAVKLSDPFTVAASAAANDLCGGIVAAEKIASSGVTTVPVYRDGIFKVYLSGACTVGDALVTADTSTYPNYFAAAATTLNISGSKVWGIALESGTNGQTILMELRPTGVNSQ